MIPLKLPMPMGIEIHNYCATPIENTTTIQKKWRPKYSRNLIPNELHLELRVNDSTILVQYTDRRRSTRVVWNHWDDYDLRDTLDVLSYESLELVIVNDFSIPLHPSRLCRIETIVDFDHLPRNAITVYFSDQSVRVMPPLYAFLRNCNERYGFVEEKRFADTAFYHLDDGISTNGENNTANGTVPPTPPPKGAPKPSAKEVWLEDLHQENEQLKRILEEQEQLHAIDLQSLSEERSLQNELEELLRQNETLEREVCRRKNHARAVAFAVRSEQVRLVAETSQLYDIDDTTIRGLPVTSAVSMMNHLIHIVLPKYLQVFCRPPPLNAPGQRNRIWMATLECQCRALRIPIHENDTVLQRIQRIYRYVINGSYEEGSTEDAESAGTMINGTKEPNG